MQITFANFPSVLAGSRKKWRREIRRHGLETNSAYCGQGKAECGRVVVSG
jgi:hypothetical protein